MVTSDTFLEVVHEYGNNSEIWYIRVGYILKHHGIYYHCTKMMLTMVIP